MAARKKSTRKVARPSGTKSRSTPRANAARKKEATRSADLRKRAAAKAKASASAKSASRAKATTPARKHKAAQKGGARPAANKAAQTRTVKGATKGELRVKAEPKKPESKSKAQTPVKPTESPAVKQSAKQAEVKLQGKSDERPQAAPAAGAKAAGPAARATPASPPAGAATAKAATAAPKEPKAAVRDDVSRSAKPSGHRHGFKLNEFVVYPAHGVGQIVAVEEQEVAGFKLELFVINFAKDKMTLRVPTAKVAGVGMRKISDPDAAKRSLEILTGRARVKRTMWSRRAQEYESKINSGDINAIAEVVRDLYRSEAQPEQSYSERQLYEAALDRMVREIAAVNKSNEIDALKAVEAQLQKSNRGPKVSPPPGEPREPEIEEAA